MASEKTIGFDIELLKELSSKLPKTEKRRRNFIDIAGYPNWENVNSNILAYYFDETEDHGFKTLFIGSLLDIYSGKLKGEFNEMISESGFYVEREVTTKKGNRIDILIRSFKEEENEVTNNGWAVIIENKIDAPLNNDLKDYWESIEADTKIGILLSLSPTPVNNKNFVNITHKQLIEKIQENLSEFYLDADDRHLLLLKEYISNINNRYRSREEDKKMEQTLWLFHEYSSIIEDLEQKKKELLRYINRCVDKVMEERGFPPKTKINNANAKHYQVTKESDLPESFSEEDRALLKKFRFWVPLSKL
ncbi:MAG: PD-(D/E)XK nuclease family protein, partial [Spirochaetia bacterium]